MGIVIPFEVVRQGKPETDEEKRIKAKEAIYRGLIEKEAVNQELPFEEMEAIIKAADKKIETRRQQDGRASRDYEHELDRNTKALRYIVEVFNPLIPEGVHIGW